MLVLTEAVRGNSRGFVAFSRPSFADAVECCESPWTTKSSCGRPVRVSCARTKMTV